MKPAMSDRKTHYLAGLKLFGSNQHEQAIVEYEAALALSPDWTEAMHALATAHSKLGHQDQAIAIVERIIELEPNDAFAYTSLSIFLQRKGLIPEAEKAAAKARMISWKEELKKNPNAPPPSNPSGMNVVQ
jgi:tetratricopeptide (TPR) repeat protein